MENTTLYDLIIVGGGPAGCSGAVYAARKKLKTAIIAYTFGGQSTDSSNIQNWIGTPSISGTDLAKSLETHVREYAGESLTIVEGESVVSIVKNDSLYTATTDMGKTHTAKTVLITSGSKRRKLEIPGAAEFEHKGITYCASCDGLLFQGQDVAVIGGGNAGFETAAQLLAYTKSVTLFNRGDVFRADEVTVEKVLSHPNMKAIKNCELVEVVGGPFVTGFTYKDLATGETTTLPVTGIFVEIGQIPNTDIAKGLVEIDAGGKIVVDPMTQRTSEVGVWAAGDCTNGLYHQNNIAAGDAVKALENIYFYLHAGK
jgi:alkyl hydroperoxide reductase subunit F